MQLLFQSSCQWLGLFFPNYFENTACWFDDRKQLSKCLFKKKKLKWKPTSFKQIKTKANARQFYGKREYYKFGSVHCFPLSSICICHLPTCWNSHLHQTGRVGRTLLSIQRILNAVMPKPLAVERYWQHSWKCPPCSYICLIFRSEVFKNLKNRINWKVWMFWQHFLCHSLNFCQT